MARKVQVRILGQNGRKEGEIQGGKWEKQIEAGREEQRLMKFPMASYVQDGPWNWKGDRWSLGNTVL